MPRTWLAEKALMTTPITRPRASKGNKSAMMAKEIDAMTPREISTWEAEIEAEITDALLFAKDSPFPAPEEMLRQVYA